MIHIYADESCKDTHKYLVLGGICVELDNLIPTLALLKQVRDKHKTYGEVKWQKVSKAKLFFYKEFVDVFFNLAKVDNLHFHSLVVDTSTFKQTNHELGFNKLIFQLLLHKFGRKYGSSRLYAHLDDRTTRYSPDDMRPMLNACLRRDWKYTNNPFKRLTFIDSKDSDIMQLNDLLIGAIGFRKNKHHLIERASPNKIELCRYIVEKVSQVQNFKPTDKGATKFTLWNFEYK